MKKYIESLLFVVAVAITFSLFIGYETQIQTKKPMAMITTGVPISRNTPPCIRIYYFIEKYAKEYNIPLAYAYGVAYLETRYEGPFQWNYDPAKTSSVGAVGPMQIMPGTAKMMWPDTIINVQRLRTDIEFNVRTSMKLLRHLYNQYGDWKTVFGCYNTGRPLINEYANKVYNYKPEFQQ
jgi:hypothetical protein